MATEGPALKLGWGLRWENSCKQGKKAGEGEEDESHGEEHSKPGLLGRTLNSDFSGGFQNSLGKPFSEGGVSSESAAAFGFFFL